MNNMNDTTLQHFRDMAETLEARSKQSITIELKNGRMLHAVYDPLFQTVTLGGSTFPVKELAFWTKACWGSKPHCVFQRITPALQETNKEE